MKIRIHRIGKRSAILLSLFLFTACEGDEGPSSVMPRPLVGTNGETVSLAGIANGATVACTRAGADVWTFSVGFTSENVRRPGTAQLLVEIANDTSGNDVWESGRGPYVQTGSKRVVTGGSGGTLNGALGPPVSSKVRFNLAVRLIDANGTVIAISETVSGLKPVAN